MRQFARDSRLWQTDLMTKFDAFIGMIGTVSVPDSPQRVRDNLQYHEDVVNANLPRLPYDSVKTLATIISCLSQ